MVHAHTGMLTHVYTSCVEAPQVFQYTYTEGKTVSSSFSWVEFKHLFK